MAQSALHRIARRSLAAALPLAVLLVGISCTLIAAGQLSAATRERDQQRFENTTRRLQSAIDSRTQDALSLLRSTASLLDRDDGYTGPMDFGRFTDALRLSEHPGVGSVGYARRLREHEASYFMDEARRRYSPDFAIHPTEPSRPDYFPILLVNPEGEGIGFDLHTQKDSYPAMDRARDSAGPFATANALQSWGDTKPPSTFSIIHWPLYKKDQRATSVSARQSALLGFAFLTFKPEQLLAVGSADVAGEAEFAVVDDSSAGHATLYQSPGFAQAGARHARFSSELNSVFAGRTWRVVARSTPGFEASTGAPLMRYLIIGGIGISLLLCGLTALQVRARGIAGAAATSAQESSRRLDEAMAALKVALEKAETARRQAEHAGRVKDDFLATLSHELRTPLNAILGWTQLLRRQPRQPDPAVDEGLEIIERNARVQTQLVSDLLDVSRVVAGKVRLKIEPVDLSKVAADAVDTARPAAEGKQITMRLAVSDDAMHVLGDADRLQQIVWNLLTNAVKFTPAGGEICVSLERGPGRVTLRVADTGEGIDPQFLPRLFDRFSQSEAGTSRSHGGLGLGLAIVKHLVDLHGGRVFAASDGSGKGSTFTLELPAGRAAAANEETATVADANENRSGQTPLAGLVVLAVDDEADARELVRRTLVAAGANVLIAGNAQEALNLLRDRRPDALIADIAMPGTDGYALIRAVRTLPPAVGGLTPAVALTGFAAPDDARRALAAGFNVHLAKPADAEAIVDAIRSAFQLKSVPADASVPSQTRRERLGLDA